MSLVIEAYGLRKSFQTHEAVRGLDLTVRKGELFALLGANGAGKTTTIQILTTLLQPDGGYAKICGIDVMGNANEVRKKISVTGQATAVDEALTGRQNLRLFAGLFGYSNKEATHLSQQLLNSFDLADAADRPVDTYSGGMRRRLDLAIGILSQPEVLFLDEPTTGLDPKSRLDLWVIIRTLVKQGTTVLLTTQYLEEADQLADRIGFIAEGKLVAVGTPSELKAFAGGSSLKLSLLEHERVAIAIIHIEKEFDVVVKQEEAGKGCNISVPVQKVEIAHAIIGSLLDHGYKLGNFTISEPSLDDVFFALTRASSMEVG